VVARVVCRGELFAWLLVLFVGTICSNWFLRVFGEFCSTGFYAFSVNL
jgi:hypothetical protein